MTTGEPLDPRDEPEDDDGGAEDDEKKCRHSRAGGNLGAPEAMNPRMREDDDGGAEDDDWRAEDDARIYVTITK